MTRAEQTQPEGRPAFEARAGRGVREVSAADVGNWLRPGERVILQTRPALGFVVLWPLGWLVGIAISGAGLAWGLAFFGFGGAVIALVVTWLLVIARIGWQALDRVQRRYLLTDRRVVTSRGVLRRTMIDIPLKQLQHVMLYRSIRERVFGLGTIGFASAGTGASEMYWLMLGDSEGALSRVREVIDPREDAEDRALHGSRIKVIGLAGGVGAGKSTVARILRESGCEVSDSDAHARAALRRPEVRARVVDCWGEGVLGEDGELDRKRIAEVVFGRPEERKKLESVVHPLVHEARMKDMERARRSGARALVIDAPLLYEAGVDRECDAVIFVDAPREERVARVGRERGWDASELTRREKAQMPLEEKRRRADHVLINDCDNEALAARTRAVLSRILSPEEG